MKIFFTSVSRLSKSTPAGAAVMKSGRCLAFRMLRGIMHAVWVAHTKILLKKLESVSKPQTLFHLWGHLEVMCSEEGKWPKKNVFATCSRKRLNATNLRTIKLGMETDLWKNSELQFGEGCLIMETLKVNIFKNITYGFRCWTCNTLCFEKNKFLKLYTTKCLKHFVQDFKWFRISGISIFISFLVTTQ